MRSTNVLILGILFTILLITFCVTRFISNNHPNIKNVSAPKIDSNTATEYKYQFTFKEIIQNNKNEEQKLQNFYEQSTEQEKRINMRTNSINLTQIKTTYKGS
jgi:predicted DNA binding CopG/RHH family protein